jgi:alkylation response protein AidB-like acyl-CoA dehydrogenase
VRWAWTDDVGRSPRLWSRLADIGLLGLAVPAEYGGLGGGEVQYTILLEETGYVALPEPVVENAVAAALLTEIDQGLAREWLPAVCTGDAILTVGVDETPYVADAHVAAALLLRVDDAVHVVRREEARLEPQPAADGARRLFKVHWVPRGAGVEAAEALARAFDRAALFTAAQLVGLGRRCVDLAVDHARARQQFGRPIGSFQALRHRLADALVAIEFARPLVIRAAWSMSRHLPSASLDVSAAKSATGAAAQRAALAALQVHGAIGYTFECDVHLFLKKAWALASAYGDPLWHRRRIAGALRAREGITRVP